MQLTHEAELRPRAVKIVAVENDEPERAHDEEAEMTAMPTLVFDLTTSIAITVMLCALMMMALG